jgi:hypothetical protein
MNSQKIKKKSKVSDDPFIENGISDVKADIDRSKSGGTEYMSWGSETLNSKEGVGVKSEVTEQTSLKPGDGGSLKTAEIAEEIAYVDSEQTSIAEDLAGNGSGDVGNDESERSIVDETGSYYDESLEKTGEKSTPKTKES